MTARSYPLPADPHEIFLDHVGHFVPSLDAAGAELERMGFVVTPCSVHVNSDDPAKPPVPAGTANRLIMLEEGYLEILAAHGEIGDATPVGRQLVAQLGRYTGVHLMAFSCQDAEGHRRRLIDAGFRVGPAVALQRDTEDEAGNADTVRFAVMRPVPGEMPEGRVQFLRHDRPDLMWQRRWMGHRNGVEALCDAFFVSADPDEAVSRYARYLDRALAPIDGGHMATLDRGRLVILSRDGFAARFPGIAIPTLPFIAGYALRCADLAATRRFLDGQGFDLRETPGGALALQGSAALGGTLLFVESDAQLPW